jgi:hypothetical protein
MPGALFEHLTRSYSGLDSIAKVTINADQEQNSSQDRSEFTAAAFFYMPAKRSDVYIVTRAAPHSCAMALM